MGWQPNDWFALNLYAKMAVYDSADDKKLDYYVYGAETSVGVYQDSWVKHGTAAVNDYKETTVGLQAIFQFYYLMEMFGWCGMKARQPIILQK